MRKYVLIAIFFFKCAAVIAGDKVVDQFYGTSSEGKTYVVRYHQTEGGVMYALLYHGNVLNFWLLSSLPTPLPNNNAALLTFNDGNCMYLYNITREVSLLTFDHSLSRPLLSSHLTNKDRRSEACALSSC
ncbi:hypothetical protein [Parashewanella spongiae]|uniref:hypothetical protein n=1 Tax=Parashewanella spongiae TaxID=342950 RepID=UPI0010596FC1|nr:hypothetical protein [Parashewanella spongiae]